MQVDPNIRPLFELETDILQNLIPEIPLWVKNPDYDRVDWLNQFILEMWPFLDKAICSIIRSTCEPMFADYIGKYMVEKIEFENLTLGTLPPTIQGLRVYETNEKELVLEPSIKWAGNANVIVSIELLSARIRLQLVDLQFFVLPRVTLKPLVPTIPCFTNIMVSLMEKPHVDFGFKVLGGDFMAIPGLYRFVQVFHSPLYFGILLIFHFYMSSCNITLVFCFSTGNYQKTGDKTIPLAPNS